MGLRRIMIDVPALIDSGADIEKIECSYTYHRRNQGVFSLLEMVEFSTYCRQCEDAFCISACPKDALEHQDNGMIKRYNMRCVGCKSCVLACPFGTIFPEIINYVTSKCDLCLEKLDDDSEYVPACVATSPEGTFFMTGEITEDPEKNIFLIGDHLAVKNPSWKRKEELI